jgi:hypothetical protein
VIENEEKGEAIEQEQDVEQEQAEVVVTIGDEQPAEEENEEHQPAPAWVRDLRKQNRELNRELREARQKLNQSAPAVPAEQPLGAKPTLESMGYDAAKYESELEKWHEKKRKADEDAAKKEAEKKQEAERWNSKLNAYKTAKDTLGVPDFEDAEEVVLGLLNPVQQGIIVQGAKDPALFVYAIGKNEKAAKELAAISDPVEFTFAVARLEGQLKVTSRKPATAPETRISGNSRPSGSTDSTLERLRAEAEKTGDYTKVTAYKRQKRGA